MIKFQSMLGLGFVLSFKYLEVDASFRRFGVKEVVRMKVSKFRISSCQKSTYFSGGPTAGLPGPGETQLLFSLVPFFKGSSFFSGEPAVNLRQQLRSYRYLLRKSGLLCPR